MVRIIRSKDLIFPLAGAELGNFFWAALIPEKNRDYATTPKRVVAKSVLAILSKHCGGPKNFKALVSSGNVAGLLHEAAKPRRRRGLNTPGSLAGASWLLD